MYELLVAKDLMPNQYFETASLYSDGAANNSICLTGFGGEQCGAFMFLSSELPDQFH